jgi:hypothetical protein
MDKERAHDCLVALWRRYKACELTASVTKALAMDIIQDAGMSVLELAAIVKETKGACPILDDMGMDA